MGFRLKEIERSYNTKTQRIAYAEVFLKSTSIISSAQIKHAILTRNFTEDGKLAEWGITNFSKFQERAIQLIEDQHQAKDKDILQQPNVQHISNQLIKNLNQKNEYLELLKWTRGLLEFKQAKELALNEIKTPSHLEHMWNDLQESAVKVFGLKEKKENLDYFEAISNPLIQYTLKQIYSENQDLNTYRAVMRARGLEVVSVTDILGDSSLCQDDEAFLQNISKLPPGFYAINLETSDIDHAISYIKQEDGSGYLLDPNGVQLQFSAPDESIRLILKLLSMYDEPKKKIPLSLIDSSQHQLKMYRIEKKKRTPLTHAKNN